MCELVTGAPYFNHSSKVEQEYLKKKKSFNSFRSFLILNGHISIQNKYFNLFRKILMIYSVIRDKVTGTSCSYHSLKVVSKYVKNNLLTLADLSSILKNKENLLRNWKIL